MAWALFKDGEQISRARDRKSVVVTEALALQVMVNGVPDFIGQYATRETVYLADGYEIKKVSESGASNDAI